MNHVILVLYSLIICPGLIQAMIFVDPAYDNNHNTSTPTGAYADSGWQWQALVNGTKPGMIVSPTQVLTAQHIGAATSVKFGGNTYTVDSHDNIADLQLITVDTSTHGAFSSWAPLSYTPDLTGKEIVVYGRGAGRQSQMTSGGELKGWIWWSGSASARALRWGTNIVDGYDGNFLVASFDRGGSAHEAQLTVGDSGGAVMVYEDGEWKVAGIHNASSGYYSNNASTDIPNSFNTDYFLSAIFDAGGLWRVNNSLNWEYTPDESADVFPGYFLSTATASYSDWLQENIILPVVVPEPTSVVLLGLAGLIFCRRCR